MPVPPHLTVLTASYNRAHLLGRLHASLAHQTVDEGVVEWLVVDDGSTDATATLLDDLAHEGGAVRLRTLRARHGGKHRALNLGLQAARAPWVMVVDSDDWCTPDALPRAMAETATVPEDVFAILAPLVVPRAGRQFSFGRPRRAVSFAQRSLEDPPFDCTLILRRAAPGLRFPEFEGEDFLAEAALLFDLGKESRVWLSDQVLVGAEYQPDGLSARIRRKRMNSPLGACHTYQTMLACPLRAGQRLRALANFGRFWWHALMARRHPLPRPASLGQALALGAGWALALADRRAESRAPRARERRD